MRIVVINGSPKSDYSITLQTVLYLQKRFPQLTFDILHAGASIRKLEADFSPAAEKLRGADLVLFSYPVYTFLAPSQLHRFIALLKASDVDLSGRYATQITTSKHFYDVTAHSYIRDNCQDMRMKFIRGLSADMEDLTTEKGQKHAEDWLEHTLWCMKQDLYEKPPAFFGPAPELRCASEETSAADNGNEQKDSTRNTSFRVAVVADLAEDDRNLASMIRHFRGRFPYETDLVNIHDFPFKGGCIGCFNCAADGNCFYRDGFDVLLRERIQKADAMIIAFTISDHSMGVPFKTYDDRQFCNGHRTVTSGKPIGYLVNGHLSREENLRLLIRARAEVGGNYLAGTAGNETDPDREIDELSRNLAYAVEHHYVQPADFYGVGGMKIFRDLIWQMRGLMKEDHKFYKQQKLYDFPQKKRGSSMLMYLVGGMMANPKIKAKMGNKMNEGMIAPYRKVLDKVERKETMFEELFEVPEESSEIRCPVCGRTVFTGENTYEICPVCGWENDRVQTEDPDFAGGANHMSLNEARAVYQAGEKVK